MRRFEEALGRYRKRRLVHEYPDGRLAIFDGPRCLARFQAEAAPIDATRAA